MGMQRLLRMPSSPNLVQSVIVRGYATLQVHLSEGTWRELHTGAGPMLGALGMVLALMVGASQYDSG